MVQFRVRASSLGEVAAQLQGVIGVFDGNVEQVASVVSSVANSSWKGEDADKFVEAWEAWNASAITVRTSLTTLMMQLNAAEGSYTSTESGLSGGFSGRRQAQGGVLAGSSAVAGRVSGGRRQAELREEGGVEAELVSTGSTEQFVGGGFIGARLQSSGAGPSDTKKAKLVADTDGNSDV